MNNQQSEIMTLTEVAEYLHCHKITVYRMVQSGEIPAFQVGSSWRLRREDIDRWIEDRHVAPVEVEVKPRPGRRKK